MSNNSASAPDGDASPPFFVVSSDGDVQGFLIREDAERAVESIDVDVGEYPAVFDSTGARFRLAVERPTGLRKWLGVVSITLAPVRLVACSPKERAPDELRRLLVDALPGARPTDTLEGLVGRGARELAPK